MHPDHNTTDSGEGTSAGADDAGKPGVTASWWALAIASCLLPWISQPPLGWWPVAAVAITPLLAAARARRWTRQHYALFYAAAVVYWALTMQGLRHANPLIYPCWIALAAYLGIYPVLFVGIVRRSLARGVPLVLAAPLAWVGIECLRNYVLTGISAAMLGHTLADVPVLIQIADLGGSYAVSLVLASVNVAVISLVAWCRGEGEAPRVVRPMRRFPWAATATAAILVAATWGYGTWRLAEPLERSSTRLALIGRSEPVEYEQDPRRQLELFEAYARESLEALRGSDVAVDGIVWPESMFTGTIPWVLGDGSPALAQRQGLSEEEMRLILDERRDTFRRRAQSLQSRLAAAGRENRRPEIIAGCGIVHYGEIPTAYSGVVHLDPQGDVEDWYGKMHLVMFGEYIPVVQSLPYLRRWIPESMGLVSGDGPRTFELGDLVLCPNICIETAVERVPLNHFRRLRREAADVEAALPDAIVTVTNDGWFDDSSIVTHHRRCAQLVAVACRRPVLSAANNGPTAWIDSSGRVVDALPQGGAGSLIAQPQLDRRTSLAVRLGDWPARLCLLASLLALAWPQSLSPSSDRHR